MRHHCEINTQVVPGISSKHELVVEKWSTPGSEQVHILKDSLVKHQ